MLIYLHSHLLVRATSGQLEAFHSLQYEVTGAQAQLWGFGHLLWGLHLDQAPLGADGMYPENTMKSARNFVLSHTLQ